ncbi:MAG: NAD(P)-dependent oxidoreductase [Desulfobacterales bacterium]|nr:NAD(P)-dependent oxidoreductase [Desulfobacterales bacterium]
MTKQTVCFIGMGVMGSPMAGHVANAGHPTTVYNRTQEKANAWAAKYPGIAAVDLPSAVGEADIVLMCLGNDQSVEDTLSGRNGAMVAMRPGTIIVDHTTTSAKLAQRMSTAANELGLHFLDAPVSGGEAGAQNGALTVMVGGEQSIFDQASPVINHFAKAVTRMGQSGAGQLTKMVNQICIAGLVQALSEGLAFSEKAGLDSKRVLDVISKGAAQSWQMENRGTTMIDRKFDFGFAVDHMRKDLGLCIEQAQQIGAQIPVAQIVDQYYAEIQAMGGARWDTSSLIKRLG